MEIIDIYMYTLHSIRIKCQLSFVLVNTDWKVYSQLDRSRLMTDTSR